MNFLLGRHMTTYAVKNLRIVQIISCSFVNHLEVYKWFLESIKFLNLVSLKKLNFECLLMGPSSEKSVFTS